MPPPSKRPVKKTLVKRKTKAYIAAHTPPAPPQAQTISPGYNSPASSDNGEFAQPLFIPNLAASTFAQPGSHTVEPRPFTLTPKQYLANELLGGPQRHTEIVGGSRSGKTFVFTRAVVVRALKAPNSRHAILRFRMNAVRQSIWMDTLPKVLRLCFPGMVQGKDYWFHNQIGYVQFANGSEIWICGLDDKDRVEKILGMEFCTMYFNECSQIPYDSVTVALTRLAQKCVDLNGNQVVNRAYYDLNPVGKFHWTYRQFILHKSPSSLADLTNPEEYKAMFINPEDNKDNIDESYLAELRAMPEKYRQRFYEGKYVDQYDNALWNLETIERYRVGPDEIPNLIRIVIAVDPSGASDEADSTGDAIGIGAIGLGENNELYPLEDATVSCSPERWAKTVVHLFDKYQADRVVAERNFGGDMVRSVIHNVRSTIPVKLVTASRGKAVRAEPVSALYDMGRVHHVGRFPELEEELCSFTTGGYMGLKSPNRADWLVWGATELALKTGVLGLSELIAKTQGSITELGGGSYNTLNVLRGIDQGFDESGSRTHNVMSMIRASEHTNNPEDIPIPPRNPGDLPMDKLDRIKGLKKPAPNYNDTKCPDCDSESVSKIPGGQKRCNSCGTQFGQLYVNLSPLSRGDLMDL